MDETPMAIVVIAFIVYWLYFKDPEQTEDKKLDEDTKQKLTIFALIASVWTARKIQQTDGESLKELTTIFDKKETPAENDNEFGNSPPVIKREIPSGTVRVRPDGPHVMEGKSFFSSETTNNSKASAGA
tara:strand:+ start:369 stop:755 length:387 start_codon:yes stop_codon:yes gene_type:complete